jgi:hypothetical protein
LARVCEWAQFMAATEGPSLDWVCATGNRASGTALALMKSIRFAMPVLRESYEYNRFDINRVHSLV